MEIVYAHEHPLSPPLNSMFLAGPSPRGNTDYDWRPEAIAILEQLNYSGTVYIPLPRNGEWLVEYDAQVDWELQYLEAAQVIVFWIPRNLERLPGYTTNVEFGLFVRSGKIVLGYPDEAPKMRYLHHLADRYGVPVCQAPHNRLRRTLEGAIMLAKSLE